MAAEEEFSQRGFDGAGMKSIAARAGVSQALLHYHLGTKDNLYSEVIRRRSDQINAERQALLDKIDLEAPDALEGVIDALVRPPFGPAGGGRAYARIFAGLVVGRERDRALVREKYDPIALRFVEAIEAAVEGLGRKGAGLGYVLTLGALISVIARDGRPERLMGLSENHLMNQDETIAAIVAFASGGIRSFRDGNVHVSEKSHPKGGST
ncbi:TetR/AcrR family transcriptional regulator [Tranquillimonas alkanivorans]|uniref:TetR/AcrR family transcriptional regulator n=1 Tax=Tranquillimonas alkanivorans TaxID=441119 RepID=UPI0015A5D942|nr:TetR/AcrR family transcriptional regulator [Tranquillimonas alkanivorans]